MKNQVSNEDEESEEDFMSDKFILQATAHDEKIKKERIHQENFDTTIKNAEKLKVIKAQKPFQKPMSIMTMMYTKLEEGLNTKIPKENKGYQMLMKLGFK